MAASKNHLETIKSLLSHNADIGAKDSNDETPIYRAASEGCIEALEVRLQMYNSCILGTIGRLRWRLHYAGKKRLKTQLYLYGWAPTVHTNLSRKRDFPKTLFKPEEFDNAGFAFSCGRKTFEN